ncbi:MAG: GNAT family N-acetyltransferase, partial [Pseudonocardia sp.]|nr:GNAT family N-acetyltransferase [Pseudonocardia sp.]
MRCTSVRPVELGCTELACWQELVGATPGPHNPFLAPEYALAVAQVRPSARVLVAEDAGRISGFLAVEEHRRIARPIGSGLTDCEGWTLADGADVPAGDALRAAGLVGWDFETLLDGQVPCGAYRVRRERSPIVGLAEGYEPYLEALRGRSKKWLSSMFRKQRKLEREVGEIRFEFASTDEAALRALMCWKSGQYAQLDEWDRFADPGIVALVSGLMRSTAPGCSGALSVLWAGDMPVAAHAGIHSDSVLSWWFPAYDPAFGRYSPGILVLLHMLEGAGARGIGTVDLGRGPHDYKDATKTGELTVVTGSVDAPVA